MKPGTQLAIVGISAAVVIIIWFACVFDSLLDFLVALWSAFFMLLLAGCITAVITVLLIDYFVHR